MDSNKYRRAWRSKGLCHDCTQPALPGHVFCEKHLTAKRTGERKKYQKRVVQGRCWRCGSYAVGVSQLCRACAQKVNNQHRRDYANATRKWRLENGRCPNCGTLLTKGETYKCNACATNTHTRKGDNRYAVVDYQSAG